LGIREKKAREAVDEKLNNIFTSSLTSCCPCSPVVRQEEAELDSSLGLERETYGMLLSMVG
jgi:3'-phosphoadenosine 5'-phosphosulfate (PAPS) 3'-phosphatase